jgi:hypothetical protein
LRVAYIVMAIIVIVRISTFRCSERAIIIV